VESAPEAWYVLGGPGTSPRAPVAVYTHQRAGWEAAVDFLDGLAADDLAAVTAGDLVARFFAACAPPRPTDSALERLVDHYRGGGGRPAAFGREARAGCEPAVLARRIREEDLGERARTELLMQRFTPLAQAVYSTPGEFRRAVDEALNALQHPDEAAWVDPPRPVFEATSQTTGHPARRPGGPSRRQKPAEVNGPRA
jgi:hypothetical protein